MFNRFFLLQKISRPLLFVSISRTVTEIFDNSKARIEYEDDQQQHPETPAMESTSESTSELGFVVEGIVYKIVQ